MSAAELTWPDGTPRSTGNAFDLSLLKKPKTKEEIEKERNSAYSRKSYLKRLEKQGKTKADVAKAMATRVNKHADLSAFAGTTNSRKAPR